MLMRHRLLIFVALSIASPALPGALADVGLVPAGPAERLAVAVAEAVVAANTSGDRLVAAIQGVSVVVEFVPADPAKPGWSLELPADGFLPWDLGLAFDRFDQGILLWQGSSLIPGPPTELYTFLVGPEGEPVGDRILPFERVVSGPLAMAATAEGKFAVAGVDSASSDRRVALRRFNREGNPLDAGSILVGEATGMRRIYRPEVALAGDGRAMVVWTEHLCDGGLCLDLEARGQLVAVDGTLEGPELLLAAGAEASGVVALPSGRFLATWNRLGSGLLNVLEPLPFAIEARSVGAGGALGPVAAVKAESGGARLAFSTLTPPAVDAAGRVLVVWEDRQAPGDDSAVFAQLLSPGLERVGDRLQVPWQEAPIQRSPSVASPGPGKFVLGWIEGDENSAVSGFYVQTWLAAPRRCASLEPRLCLESIRSGLGSPLEAHRALP